MDEKDQVLEEMPEQAMPAEGEMPPKPEGFPPMGGKHGGPGMPPPPPPGFKGGPGMPPPPFDGEKPPKPEGAPAEEAPAAE